MNNFNQLIADFEGRRDQVAAEIARLQKSAEEIKAVAFKVKQESDKQLNAAGIKLLEIEKGLVSLNACFNSFQWVIAETKRKSSLYDDSGMVQAVDRISQAIERELAKEKEKGTV